MEQQQTFDVPKFEHPFTCMVAGPSRAGKTEFVKKLVRNVDSLIYPVPQEIIWCYCEWQTGYVELMNVPKLRLVEGLPNIDELKASIEIPKLLILDDLMAQMDGKKNNGLVDLFTRGSHHWSCSTIHVVQNAFYGNIRTARINSHYIVLMRNPSDKLQASTLAKQLYPGQQQFFMDAYRDACSKPYGYLVIDMASNSSDDLRLRTNIFPDSDRYMKIYLPKV
jgi:hypothetical protein